MEFTVVVQIRNNGGLSHGGISGSEGRLKREFLINLMWSMKTGGPSGDPMLFGLFNWNDEVAVSRHEEGFGEEQVTSSFFFSF